jgi:hypothetical protein
MAVYEERRQVLLAGAEAERAVLRGILAGESFDRWQVSEADSIDRARFLLQHESWDVFLMDESIQKEDRDGLEWLAAHAQVPWLFLAGAEPAIVASTLAHGLGLWLPRALTLNNPALLAGGLHQADRMGELQRRALNLGNDLKECRRQVNRLVSLLWDSSPADPRISWFTQRHMMDRLHEEVARTERHGIPLSVVLGEVQPRHNGEVRPEDHPRLSQWAATQIVRTKRRADVAGQYGPHGFMLLLVHTPEPGAQVCCQRLQSLIEQPSGEAEPPPAPGLAFLGISTFAAPATNPKSLLSRAEERLEEVKSARMRQRS